MVQYYQDLWKKRSQLLAPLTDLVNECGHVKVIKKNNTRKELWHWDDFYQKAFEKIKKVMAHDFTLAYSDYSLPFDIYTDASSRQLGLVIVQNV